MAILFQAGARAANYFRNAGTFKSIAAVGVAAGAAYVASQSLFPSCAPLLEACSTCFKTVLKGEEARVLFYNAKKGSCYEEMNAYIDCGASSLYRKIALGILAPCAILLAQKANQIVRNRFPALHATLPILKPILLPFSFLSVAQFAGYIRKTGLDEGYEVCRKLESLITGACNANNLNYFRCSQMESAGYNYCSWKFSDRNNNLEDYFGIVGAVTLGFGIYKIAKAFRQLNQINWAIPLDPLVPAAPPIFNGRGLNLRDYEDGKRPEGWGQAPAARNAQAQPAQEAKVGDVGEA